MKNQIRYPALTVFVLFLGLTFNFNNCGRSPRIEGFENANRSIDSRLRSVKTVNEGKLPLGFCTKGANYGCLHKVFSRTAEEREYDGSPQCVTGGMLCVNVVSRTYNSAVLAQDCADCEFDYDEFECHVKLPDQTGIYPLIVTARSFDDAVTQVRDLCEMVSGGQ